MRLTDREDGLEAASELFSESRRRPEGEVQPSYPKIEQRLWDAAAEVVCHKGVGVLDA